MKRLLIIMALMSVINVYSQNLYDNGWQKGYQEGYCYQDYGCISPIPPISPLPLVGESYNDYKAGYQRGFLAGRQARQNVNSSSNQSGYHKKPRELAPYVQPFDTDMLMEIARQKQERLGRERAEYDAAQKREMGNLIQILSNPDTPKGFVNFWTNTDKYGYIDVWVNGLYMGRITTIWISRIPVCGDKEMVIYGNIPGTYSVYARSATNNTWTANIVVKEDDCYTFLLK